MKPELYRNVKNVCAAILAFVLLAGADCGSVLPQCNNGDRGAYRTLGGQLVIFTSDNNTTTTITDNTTTTTTTRKITTTTTTIKSATYAMTILDPDPYIRWKGDVPNDGFGIQSFSCFKAFWESNYGDDTVNVVIWQGSDTPACGTLRHLRLPNGIITAEVTVKGSSLSSGPAVLLLNKSSSSCSLPCSGESGLTKECFAPFASLGDKKLNNSVSVPGADLNFATFDGAQLRNADLRGTTLSYASFTSADLTDANFDDAVLIQTDFTGALMSGAVLGNARVYQVIAPDGYVADNATALLNHRID